MNRDEEPAARARGPAVAASVPAGRPGGPLDPPPFVVIAVVVVLTGAALTWAFHPDRAGEPALLAALGVPYAALSAWAVLRLRARGELAVFRPRSGDIALGASAAVLLYAVTIAGRTLIAPAGSPREAWIVRTYLQVGQVIDPRTDATELHLVAAVVFVVAVLEEIVWRGLVMRALGRYGALRAWLGSAVLFAAVHAATLWHLRMPIGPNPLVVLAALAGGIVWGHLLNRTGRLVPGLVAHGLFTWALIEFPLWRP